MPRPPVELDLQKLEDLMQFRPTQSDAAAFFRVSEDTIERRIREHYDLTFSEFRERFMANTRLSLTKKALQMALSGNVAMLIWCQKNLCGWRDKQPDEETPQAVIHNNQVAMSGEELVRLVREAKESK